MKKTRNKSSDAHTDHGRQLPSRIDKEGDEDGGENDDYNVNEYAITTPRQKTKSTRRTPAVTTRSLSDTDEVRSGGSGVGASTSEAAIKSSAESLVRQRCLLWWLPSTSSLFVLFQRRLI
jgi:hypothetical protein